MVFDQQVLAFIAVAAILTITPGADTLLVIRGVLARGAKAGLWITVGICCGLFVHALLSAAGLSLLLLHSATAFAWVKMIGALYLIFLGAQSLWAVARNRDDDLDEMEVDTDPALRRKSDWTGFREGLFSNVLNPKVAIFYLAFLPQFLSPGDPVILKSMVLTTIHFVMGVAWLSLVAVFLGKMRAWFVRSGVRRWLEGFSGAVLVALGIGLALERK
ncbi:LysE family translocator [Sulfidibacter corallicola]|uniref:LysE family translocator n=1 Tax=Sulfidibacter corallicola TaxID=2818388 RepID=A0A8A4TSQ6_SULCO|nr:LysE family translocator [Sulfidibacter corallicola]QTD52098.1 LysE family translocator [Sulfidibacter corallicola]